MGFKRFRLQVTLRVLVLTAAISLLAYCLVLEYYLRSAYAASAVILVLIELIWYVDRFNRDFNSFLLSLRQRDFTTHFKDQGRSASFDQLYGTLNDISDIFRAISAEKEAQFRYLELLVEHIRVGILTLDESGRIHLANRASKTLLHREVLFSLKSLESVSAELVHTLREIRSGETRLLKVRVGNEMLHLSIHASEFYLENKYHKLVSLQNIRNELDAREMEAWQKLIRVLTHEIMNSVSPVISLSETLHKLLRQHKEALHGVSDLYQPLDRGLDAIRSRTEGLFHFTQSYRKLTGIPQLSLKETSTLQLIDRVRILLEQPLKTQGIQLRLSVTDLPVVVDPELMEQVMINLVKNAMEALAGTADPSIAISAARRPDGSTVISVRDNGPGIDEAIADKVFVPFFTTRKNGSGIGLPLVRQILQLHHADIRFQSEPGKGTEFIIVL